MDSTTLSSGHTMPMLGLGTWRAEDQQLYDTIRMAIEIGYRHIDCAAIYLNEPAIGRALYDAIKAGDVKREDLFITSKLWNSFHAPDQVQIACQRSLDDLQLDYLDLYLMHWPVAQATEIGLDSPTTPDGYIDLEQCPLTGTYAAMEQLVELGLVRSIGVSNFSARNLNTIQDHANIMPAVNQVESHPYLAQPKLWEYCQKHGIAMTAYAPLGSRGRPEKIRSSKEPYLLEHPTLAEIAKAHDASTGQIAIAWQLCRGVSTIPKSTNPERLKQNFLAHQLQLTQADMEQLNALDMGYRFVKGKLYTVKGSPYTQGFFWD